MARESLLVKHHVANLFVRASPAGSGAGLALWQALSPRSRHDRNANPSLPYLQSQQAQKHVTLNEALHRLDALVQLAVLSRTLAAEPASPTNVDRYLLPDGATGEAWDGAGAWTLIAFQGGGWEAFTPIEGWRVFVVDEALLLVWHDGDWSAPGEQAARLGINTSADDLNRLSVKSDAELFSHDYVTPGSPGRTGVRRGANQRRRAPAGDLCWPRRHWRGHAQLRAARQRPGAARQLGEGEPADWRRVTDRAMVG